MDEIFYIDSVLGGDKARRSRGSIRGAEKERKGRDALFSSFWQVEQSDSRTYRADTVLNLPPSIDPKFQSVSFPPPRQRKSDSPPLLYPPESFLSLHYLFQYIWILFLAIVRRGDGLRSTVGTWRRIPLSLLEEQREGEHGWKYARWIEKKNRRTVKGVMTCKSWREENDKT